MKSYFKNNRPAALFVRNRIVYDRFENAIEYDQAFIHPDYYSIDIIN
jgi:DNA-binding GntR family transcriptional regulator